MFDPVRFQEEQLLDSQTEVTYHLYGEDGIVDPQTGIVLQRLTDDPTYLDGVVQINSEWYRLNRRHLTPSTLRAELESNFFRVHYQDPEHGGHLICSLDADKR